jgi:hypothetical protein
MQDCLTEDYKIEADRWSDIADECENIPKWIQDCEEINWDEGILINEDEDIFED